MSRRDRLLAQRQIALVISGLLLMLYPPLLEGEFHGLPWSHVALFGVWVAFIALTWLIGRAAAGDDP
jgi:hypothetical protein